jgi:chromate transporter
VQAPLDGVMAAVVGVILNLAVWFALHVAFDGVTRTPYGPLQLWTPDWGTVNWPAIGIAALASVALFRFRWSTPAVLLGGAALGIASSAIIA